MYSFHVGSGCQTPSAYEMALQMSAEMFQFGAEIGYNFNLLDIGGVTLVIKDLMNCS